MWDPLAGKAAAPRSARGDYSTAVGGGGYLWMWQLATGKATSGSPDYSMEVGGGGFGSWMAPPAAIVKHRVRSENQNLL
ncbi:hypothetical protein A2U01_0035934 [Trifolium medium]|uniref:Uncharacterized protein n=1 Tax=Trifolium medium TaxID=97028 RepID=A0A392PSZ6_9FABA|nr:hypothetical protein [Trifolium medium]